MKNNIFVKCIALFFGSGKMPFAPGTFGSLLAIILAMIIKPSSGWLLIITIFSIIIGIWASNAYIDQPNQDPAEVVIDEAAGIFLSLYICNNILLMLTSKYPQYNLGLYIYYAAIFIGFRFFDITKIFPISYFDQNIKGGLGIMLDDLVASIMSSTVIWLLALLIFRST